MIDHNRLITSASIVYDEMMVAVGGVLAAARCIVTGMYTCSRIDSVPSDGSLTSTVNGR